MTNSTEPALGTTVDRADKDASRVETLFEAATLDENGAGPSGKPPGSEYPSRDTQGRTYEAFQEALDADKAGHEERLGYKNTDRPRNVDPERSNVLQLHSPRIAPRCPHRTSNI